MSDELAWSVLACLGSVAVSCRSLSSRSLDAQADAWQCSLMPPECLVDMNGGTHSNSIHGLVFGTLCMYLPRRPKQTEKKIAGIHKNTDEEVKRMKNLYPEE